MNPELRRMSLGGSDIGAIFGADENRDAFSVWWSKKGRSADRDEPNERMLVGKALEQGVLSLYTHVTGRKVEYHDRTMIHPTRPWMAFTPDALCTEERRGVDAKVVFWDQRYKWGQSADEIPDRIQMQCWWYMAALDYDQWDVAALIGEGLPRIYTIHRDQEVEKAMLERAREWHARYILGDEHPPMSGSDECHRWLQATFPNHRRPDIREADQFETDIMMTYGEIRGVQQLCIKERKRLEAILKEAVGNSEGISAPSARFTWRRTKDGTAVDWKALAKDVLENHVANEQVRRELEMEYTRVKPGIRRIHFKADGVATGEDEE